MKYNLLLIMLSLSRVSCGQNGLPAETCEGCEAIYESPVPFEKLEAVCSLPDFSSAGPKIEISGTVYLADGKTPAKDVVIYVYHTDQSGHYPVKSSFKGLARRHGYIRGWMKTDERGYYKFYTLRPAAYPERTDPAHIHIIIREPGRAEYWIDEFLFADDVLLTADKLKKCEQRGGSGILNPVKNGALQKANRNIILGMNIPGY